MKNVLDCPAVKDNVILSDGALRTTPLLRSSK